MNQPLSRASFSRFHDPTDLADRSTTRGQEEALVLDARAELRPAELVERKLYALLKNAPVWMTSRHGAGRVKR
jgi:hypothetical protein